MKKRLFLLPILTLSLALAGCSFSDEGGQQSGGNTEPAAKEIWEEDLVEGESTIAQVKAGTVGQYYKVRGTVAASSGSTFSLYRNGEYLYCYNFNSDTTTNGGQDKLEAHPLGAYVEVYAQLAKRVEAVQLTAYDVGDNKTSKKWDGDAYLKKLADRGEAITPTVAAAEADFNPATACGKLVKASFIPLKDFKFTKGATANQDAAGKVGELTITLRADKYLDEAAQTALFGDEGLKLDVGCTYEVIALAIPQSTEGKPCHLLIVDASSIKLTNAPNWDAPTAVAIEAPGDVNELEVGETLQLEFKVSPNTAKPAVEWSSEDDTILTVDEDGLVKAKAVGTKKIYATASKGEVSVRGEYEITVKAASVTYNKVTSPVAGTKYKAALLFNGETMYFSTGEMSGKYGKTSTDAEQAADWEVVAVTGGYNIKITLEGDVVKYANAVVSGTYLNFVIDDAASTVWTFNNTWYGFATTLGDTEVFMGTSRTYNTIGVSATSYIKDNNVDVAGGQYPVHLYTVATA